MHDFFLMKVIPFLLEKLKRMKAELKKKRFSYQKTEKLNLLYYQVLVMLQKIAV